MLHNQNRRPLGTADAGQLAGEDFDDGRRCWAEAVRAPTSGAETV